MGTKPKISRATKSSTVAQPVEAPPQSRNSRRKPATNYDSDGSVNDSEDEEEKKPVKRSRNSAVTPRKRRKIIAHDDQESETEAVTMTPRRKSNRERAYDSDALDDDSDNAEYTKSTSRKSTKSPAKPKVKGASSPSKRKRRVEQQSESDPDVPEGHEVIGKIVEAPTTGLVPPGQISRNTFNFLTKLNDPACNDRDWFKLHEPIYRVAEKEWKDFVEVFTDLLLEVDPQIPQLPPKDVINRIYRDIRFSNDKTPYKRNLSAILSRSGRKGIFAKYYISVQPGNESVIAAGLWAPGRNELANFRTNLQRDSRRFRRVISSPEFVEFFGKAEPHPKGHRQNIFGREDQLKVAPKGVPKDHSDIDILKCRSIAVNHVFTDAEVLDPDFKNTLAKVAKVMKPFVYILNDLLTVGGGGQTQADSDDDDAEEDGEDGEDAEEGEGEVGEGSSGSANES